MADYKSSRSYGNGTMMQLETYHEPPPPRPASNYDLWCYIAPYSQSHMADNYYPHNGNCSKPWNFGELEFQRKKRVATYKMYSAESKVKGSLKRSFRWLKHKYIQVVYGWW
ncbi:hypothetical protein ERO13_A07G022025v2 [Gossypium hirsutum]|nr:hypothetical protein ERO13_A07G022025v2 [Gossypium hirsutum]